MHKNIQPYPQFLDQAYLPLAVELLSGDYYTELCNSYLRTHTSDT
jgi:hypothetical protein